MCKEYEKGFNQGYTDGCSSGYNKAMKEIEQKPSEWSEEDDYRIRWIISLLTNMQEKGIDDRYGDSVPDDIPDMISWLKSLHTN